MLGRQRTLGPHVQRGLSLVELMVGVAVGLFVVAGATMVVSTQLGDNRRLLLETQLQQDLRATLDIVAREIRRASGVADATALGMVWQPDSSQVLRNNLADIELDQGGAEIRFRYRRGGNEGPYGFRLDGERIQSLLGDNWQELTDSSVMRVTFFSVTPTALAVARLPCPQPCLPDATGSVEWCWPTLDVRAYVVDITAESRSDNSVQRSARSTVRVRNDILEFNDPANPTKVCPT